MASRYTINPSPWSTSISELLLFYFGESMSREALSALENRDADWRADNDELRSQCRSLNSELCELNRWLEAERNKQRSMEDEIARREENERWLQVSIRECEEKERDRKEEVDRLWNDKVLLEEKLRDVGSRLAKAEEDLTFEVLNKDEAIDRVLKDKAKAISELRCRTEVLEEKKMELKAEVVNLNKVVSKKVSESRKLYRKIEALEMEKGEIEADLCKLKSKKSSDIGRIPQPANTILVLKQENVEKEAEIERIMTEKKAVEDQNKRMEEEMKERTSELIRRNDILEKEKGAMEAEFRKKDAAKSTEIEGILNDMKALEALKSRMEAEMERIMKEKTDLDMEKRRAEECLNEANSELVHKIEGLERDKGALQAEVSKAGMQKNWLKKRMDNVKRTLEADKRRLKEDKNKKISELVKRIEDLEKEKGEMEAEVCKANKNKNDASNRIVEVNKALEAQKSLAEKTVGDLERAKEELEAKVSEVNREICKGIQRIGVLEKEKEEMEAKVCQASNEKSEEIKRILNEKEALEALKRAVEDEGMKNVSELIKGIEELKKEKREMEAKFCQAEKEKSTVKEDYDKKISELADRNAILESEKRGFEAEIMEKDEVLGDLERAKEALEATVLKIDREKSKGIERILNKKMASEDEKRTREDEGTKRIEVLEAMVCQVKQENCEEIQRILNEKRAMKEDYEKKISEVVDRNNILEREKRGFEADIAERDEVIKVLKEEKSCLEDMKKELEMEINGLASKSMEDVHLTNNVVSLSTPRQNGGQSFSGMAHSSEHSGSINHDIEDSDGQYEDEMTRTNACKRKRPIRKCEEIGEEILKPANEPMLVPCEKNTEMYSKRRTYGRNGHGHGIQVAQDLSDAFDTDPQLCLKAVCALYRQHTRLADSPEPRGFKPEYSSEGIALAEYLISEDPEGRKTKKMVAKLEKFDRDAVGLCTNIAKQHCKQIFEIYKEKEDPYFLF